MALRVQSAFAGGELDPALWERTTLSKYDTGLATARNVVIHKTGRVISRQSRKFFVQTKLPGYKSLMYSPPTTGILIEWGHMYVRSYSIDQSYSGQPVGTLMNESTHTFTQSDLPNIKFTSSGTDIYIFCGGKHPLKYSPLVGGGFYAQMFFIPNPAVTTFTVNTNATGYNTEYFMSAIIGGQESGPIAYVGNGKMPIEEGEYDTLRFDVQSNANLTAINIYRRPQGAGAYGFVAQVTPWTGTPLSPAVAAGYTTFSFTDIGGGADYTHTPVAPLADLTGQAPYGGPDALNPHVGTIFQQRLVMDNYYNPGQVVASRVGYPTNFTQNFPLDAASALSMYCGTAGSPKVIDMIENEGLNVFTNQGLFLFTGTMSPDDLALTRKGPWTIDPLLQPLAVPGGVLFNDKGSNAIRILTYSTEAGGYLGEELSIFSNHLFQSRQMVSWAYQQGDLPIAWAVMADGTFLSFTYVADQEMRAWTRHDSAYPVEQVAGTGLNQLTAFMMNVNGTRYIELSQPRYATAAMATADAQFPIGPSIAFMDSYTAFDQLIPSNWTTLSVIALTKQSDGLTDNLQGPLTIKATGAQIFYTGFNVGQVLRVFDTDFSYTDLTITRIYPDGYSIDVMPSDLYPASQISNPNIYLTWTTLTGLGYMEGELPVIVCDGNVISSPNNTISNIDPAFDMRVTNGQLTLPNGLRGARIYVGRAIVADTGTLDIATVEQRPILIESKIVNKVYVKVYNTKGLYAAANFPSDNTNTGMMDMDSIVINPVGAGQVLGNAYEAPQTKRCEVSIPGDWDSNGRFAMRQVDPVHFEILSIIPDVNDLRRQG